MSSPRIEMLQRAALLFDEWVDETAQVRASRLAALVQDEPGLADTLQRLFAAHERALGQTNSDVMASVGATLRDFAQDTDSLAEGTMVGPFKVARLIGVGGMGQVYLGVREIDGREQQVAIKLPNRRAAPAALARFRSERAMLASLSHPAIARLVDAGSFIPPTLGASSSAERPYLAMEYVEGTSIDAYADTQGLTIDARLSLVSQLLSGLQYAHERLIVHRDIKAENVLVDANGQPRILDFGIGKTLDDLGTSTAEGQRYFSLASAAPEQIRGEPSSAATDVYACGVLLYELLCGVGPLDLAELSVPAALDLAMHGVPALASQRFAALSPDAQATIARARQCSPAQLRSLLEGDIDAILARALRKEPEQRYATAQAFADDIAAVRESRPIDARRSDRAYRLRRFIKRHRVATSLSALTAIVLLTSVVVLWLQADNLRQARDTAEQVADFQSDMLSQIDPRESAQRLTTDVFAAVAALPVDAASAEQRTVFKQLWYQLNTTDIAMSVVDKSVLAPAKSAIPEEFAAYPEVEAALNTALAGAYQSIGRSETALPLAQRALEVRSRLFGKTGDTLNSMQSVGLIMKSLGRADEAEPLLRETHDLNTKIYGPDHLETIDSMIALGFFLSGDGQLDEAESYYKEALARSRVVFGEHDRRTLVSLNNYGMLLMGRGQFVVAEKLLRETLNHRNSTLGVDHRDTITSLHNLAIVTYRLGHGEQALALMQSALEGRQRVLGSQHHLTLASLSSLATIMQQLGRPAEAEILTRQAMKELNAVMGPAHPTSHAASRTLASLLIDQGKFVEAETLLRELIALAAPGVPKNDVLTAHSLLGRALAYLGRFSDADPLLQGVLNERRVLFGNEHFDTNTAIINLAELQVAQGRHQDALSLLVPIETVARKLFTGVHRYHLMRYLLQLGNAQAAMGRFAEAESVLTECFATVGDGSRDVSRDLIARHQAMVNLYSSWTEKEPTTDVAKKLQEWRQRLASVADQEQETGQ